ncbi:MAG TPA: ABC transporter substrate-binding protein [Pseudolabrys sp.]|nr:ABC transporter substrate-binding protein [Pseudolabrys sp.]
MRRREFIKAITSSAAAAAWPLEARTQQRSNVPRVGYLFSFTRAEGEHLWEACRQGLRDLGYVEGQNIILEPRLAEGHNERLATLAAELVQLKVDVIVAAATPASRAAKAATSTIPVVFVAVGDPVKAGLVATLAQPGGNVTGLSLLTSDLSGKRLSLLMETVRRVARVAILMNPDNPISAVFLEETKLAAQQLRTELQPFNARNPEEIAQAFAVAAGQRIDAVIVFDDPVLWSYRAQIVALADVRKIPAVYGYRDFVDQGGLMSYGPDRPDQYRRTAIYIDKILKGAKPSELPIEQPTKFELIVNRKTAKSLGIELPASVIVGANEVIE